MAIIIETCPKCGHDLVEEVLCTYPSIPKKSCWSCGWSWTGEPEQVLRVPFGGNSLDVDATYDLHGNTDDECINADCCMANNFNENVFTVRRENLDFISKISYDDLVAAVDRAKKYIKE